ncbi:histidine phosphatase family protein [Berryella wangjianweii]|uniref:phosphoglycerate mutase (2,3-diphosphoglycerate-dependent) n=1 Tax=Berryella wangjianweii TaxID=2734634 RepID=A0A6M8IW37_9ACTN|nr:histidine phosphatase family protein [Berryella wangjianweii]QKF06865.1 histidine phosphatase family protein [Berryella wangjianweii]
MRLALLRHAATPANRARTYLGCTDEPLDQRGLDEAHAARAAIRSRLERLGGPPDRIHASTLSRTHETARALFPSARIIRHADLNEMNFGVFEGKTFTQLSDDPRYRAWVEGGCTQPCPCGEGRSDLTARTVSCLRRIVAEEAARGADLVVIVAHAGTAMAALAALADPPCDYFAARPPHCAGWLGVTDRRLTRIGELAPLGWEGRDASASRPTPARAQRRAAEPAKEAHA